MLLKPDLDQASKDLIATAEHLKTHGWCQNRFGPREGPNCIIGAMRAIGLVDSSEAYSRLCASFGTDYWLVDWNDALGRTKEQVIDRILEVAYNQPDIHGLDKTISR